MSSQQWQFQVQAHMNNLKFLGARMESLWSINNVEKTACRDSWDIFRFIILLVIFRVLSNDLRQLVYFYDISIYGNTVALLGRIMQDMYRTTFTT